MPTLTAIQTSEGVKWRVKHRAEGYLPSITFADEDNARSYLETFRGHRKVPFAVLEEELEFMLGVGQRITDVAAAFGMKPASVEKACYRAGRVDLIERDRRIAREGGVR